MADPRALLSVVAESRAPPVPVLAKFVRPLLPWLAESRAPPAWVG